MKITRDLYLSAGRNIVREHHGLWFFGLQRLTGFLLAVYLILHILINSSALFGSAETYDWITSLVQGPGFQYLEILVVLGVFFHLFNGLRIIIADFFALTRRQGTLLALVSVFTAIMFAYTVWVYLPKLTGMH